MVLMLIKKHPACGGVLYFIYSTYMTNGYLYAIIPINKKILQKKKIGGEY